MDQIERAMSSERRLGRVGVNIESAGESRAELSNEVRWNRGNDVDAIRLRGKSIDAARDRAANEERNLKTVQRPQNLPKRAAKVITDSIPDPSHKP